MEYFRIINWEKHQHRDVKNHKNMSWFKMYTDILIDPKMHRLTPAQVGIWCKLMALVAKIGNEVPHDHSYLRSSLQLPRYRERLPLALFEDLGLIQTIESAVKPRIEIERKKERKSEYEKGRSRGSLTDPTAPTKSIQKNVRELIADTNKKLGILK